MENVSLANPVTSVEVTKIDTTWNVTIIEAGDKAVKTFSHEPYARSFADGQRVRLGLKIILAKQRA